MLVCPTTPPTWGALMEVGYPEFVVTRVALVDGHTSIYVSNGAGHIGVGEDPGIREFARRFLVEAAGRLDELIPTPQCPLPEIGHVRIHVLTADGPYTGDELLPALQDPAHPLHTVAHTGFVLEREINEFVLRSRQADRERAEAQAAGRVDEPEPPPRREIDGQMGLPL